jgi:hypothetical protein
VKILIDESLPRYLKRVLHEHDTSTVQEMDWSSIKNGLLLACAEGQFDVFLTADKNLRYQQSLKDRIWGYCCIPIEPPGCRQAAGRAVAQSISHNCAE